MPSFEPQLTLFTLPAPPADPHLTTHPGQQVDTDDTARDGLATAVFSPCRRWRYQLSRIWDADLPRINLLLLNPSTADAFHLDPTLRRAAGYVRDWGGGALVVTNCFAWRATSPAALAHVDDPVGPDNDDAIVTVAAGSDLVVAGWGTHAVRDGRDRQVRQLLADTGIDLHLLARTKDGHPRHPLYLPRNLTPQPDRP